MAADLTNEFVQQLARASGLQVSNERADLVRRQYQSYLDTLADLDTLPFERETEPSITYSPTLIAPPGGLPEAK